MTPRIAVVTGGSSGIGRALVAELHGRGWTVHTCGRDAERLRQLERELPGVRTHVCDVADRAAVRAFAAAVEASSGAVHLVVSNAGRSREIDFTGDLSGVDLGADLRVHTEGALHLVAEFLPALRRGAPSTILVVSSGYALAPATRAPTYSAAKAALHSLARSLRRQLAPCGVSVTELILPVVDTPSVAHRQVAKMGPDEVACAALDGVERRIPQVRLGRARFLPLLLRLAPEAVEALVART